MLGRRLRGGVEKANHFARLLGRDRKRCGRAEMVGDIRVVAIPVSADGLQVLLFAVAEEHSAVGGRFLGPVDVADAKRFLLGIDAELGIASLGPDHPPAGPVEPADPTALDLEQDLVELQHAGIISGTETMRLASNPEAVGEKLRALKQAAEPLDVGLQPAS